MISPDHTSHPPAHALGKRPPIDKLIRRLLIGVVCLAVFLRLLHLSAVSQTAFLRFPLVIDQSDMYAFWQWAHRILDGDWLGRDTYHPNFEWREQIAPLETWYRWWGGKEIFHQAPLYPYLLAGLLSLKDSLTFVIFIQLLLGSLHPLILFFLARRLFDDRVALIAATLAALYGPFIFYQGIVLRDWLPPILEPLILLSVLSAKERGRTGAWLSAGIVMGLGIVVKETALALIGVTFVWLAIQFRRAWREAVRPFALVGAGLLLCLTPLVLRNIAVGAPPFAISVQGPGSVIAGFSAGSLPVGYTLNPLMDSVRERAGGSLWAAGREALRTHEGDYVGLFYQQLFKLRGLVGPFEMPNNESYSYGLEISPVLAFTLGYSLIFPLGAAGLLLLLRSGPRSSLLYWYLASALVVQFATFILARFRLAFVPVLMLAAAFMIMSILDRIRARQLVQAAGALALVFVFAAIQQLWAPMVRPEEFLRPTEYIYAAQTYAAERKFDRAVKELVRFRRKAERGLADSPGKSFNAGAVSEAAVLEGGYHLEWASQLFEHKNTDEARMHISLAEDAYANQPQGGLALYNLGLVYLKLRDREKAKMLFARYLELEPGSERADNVRRLLSLLAEE